MSLTFQKLREINIARSDESFPIAKDWTPDQWFVALMGEVGEAANDRKKFNRGDYNFPTAKKKIAAELADIQMYLDLVAHSLGIDLEQAIIDKFDEVSTKVGSTKTLR